ncbi:hypothetical protein [Paenibacillus sp. Marseille-Q4541]|uniref:hypothetical protein n=1 Tax=Paenibacillus sp. Marseille-Q4541 TaxID=2831522 RepID=UPI001BACC36D|nr:hypothetical protein [Paenibacillus sp. Marseille-Q4541]
MGIAIAFVILFIVMGIFFLVKSKSDPKNKGFYLWIGIALIVMTALFVLIGTYQIIDPDPHSAH